MFEPDKSTKRTAKGYYHIKPINKKWLEEFAQERHMKASPVLDQYLDKLRKSSESRSKVKNAA